MRFCGLLLLGLLMVAPACAVEGEVLNKPTGPIEVTSDQMDADQLHGRILFSGHVIGKRGSMTIYADQLTLFLIKVAEEQTIDHLVAEGHVRVVDGERVATSKRLDYDQKTEKMLLTGDAEVHQGGNLVAGEEIEIFVKQDRSLARGGQGGRVRAVFQPRQTKP